MNGSFTRRWLFPIALAFVLGAIFVVGGMLIGQRLQSRGFEIVGIVMAFAVGVGVPTALARKGHDDQSLTGRD